MAFDIASLRRTVFYTEGHSTALLVSRVKRGHRERVLSIASGEAALAWCRQHAAGLVYLPADALSGTFYDAPELPTHFN